MIVSRKYGEHKEGRRKIETGLNKNRKRLKEQGNNTRDKHTKDE